MKQEMKDLARWVMQTAQENGASEAAVSVLMSREVSIRYHERKPKIVKEASTQSLALEIYDNGRYTVQRTPDLRRSALGDFILKQIHNTSYLEADPFRSLPDPAFFEGRAEIDLQKIDPAYDNLTVDQRHQKAREVEEACLGMNLDALLSVETNMEDVFSESFAITSNGFEGEDAGTTCGLSAEITIGDEGDRKINGVSYGITRRVDELPGPETLAREAAGKALIQRGARKIPTTRMPVIIQNFSAPRLFSGFISAMYGGNIQQRRSFLMDKKGQKMGSGLFTIEDDPLLVKGLASRLYDSDGFPGKKRIMVEGGVLKDFYIDWYYSRKLERGPTTGGASNLSIPAGKRTVEQIMKDLGKGIIIASFIGGNSNSTTGDFSIGIMGSLFENGQISQAVSEMNIAGNHQEVWHKLVETANDPWPYSSYCFPSLVFDDMMVAGA